MESQTINNSIIDSQLSTSSNRKVNSSVNIDSQLEGLSLNNKDTFTHQDMALVSGKLSIALKIFIIINKF